MAPVERPTGSITVQAAVVPAAVIGISIEVTAPDIASPVIANIPVVNGAASGVVNVPAGANRRFVVRAYDATGLQTHVGETTLTIRGGANQAVTIALQPLAGQQPITVTFGTFAVAIENPPTVLQPGASRQLTAVVVDGAGNRIPNPTLQWGSLNPAVASVDGLGRVTALAVGQTRIGVTYQGATISIALAVAGGYTMTVLPLATTPAQCCTGAEALAINDAGEVVGLATVGNNLVAFRWTASAGMTLIGPVPAFEGQSVYSVARAINDGGEIVGQWLRGAGRREAMRGTFAGGMSPIPDLPGPPTDATSISSTGAVVGTFLGSNPAGGSRYEGFLWSGPGQPVTFLGPWFPQDINATGVIVGYQSAATAATADAVVRLETGQLVPLPTLGGQVGIAQARAINDANVVVGISPAAGGESHACRWRLSGEVRDLGTLGGPVSEARDINLAGTVVGTGITAAGEIHAFVWTEAAGLLDLGTLTGATGSATARAINARGQIVGSSVDASGRQMAVMWTPVGTPLQSQSAATRGGAQ